MEAWQGSYVNILKGELTMEVNIVYLSTNALYTLKWIEIEFS
jgi:hypothetical protein